MVDPTEAQRLARQRDHDLVQQGRDLERTDSRLKWLEARDREVNGQIKALTAEVATVNATTGRIEEKLVQREKTEKDADTHQLSRWTVLGIAVGMLTGVTIVLLETLQLVVGR